MGVTPNIASRQQVRNFLNDYKELLYEGRYIIKDPAKNLAGLVDLGLTPKQREEELLSLSVEHYFSGPKPDEYRPREQYWEFGKMIDRIQVYIKLEIMSHGRNEIAVVMSFHRALFPMKLPYSENANN